MQRFRQRFIAVAGDIFADILRIELTAVFQRDPLLLGIEADLVDIKDLFLRDFVNVVHLQPFYRLPADEVLFDDLADIVRFDMTVENFIGIDRNDRTFLAQTETAGLDDADFLIQTAGG